REAATRRAGWLLNDVQRHAEVIPDVGAAVAGVDGDALGRHRDALGIAHGSRESILERAGVEAA
ncbi:MAG TPA: hypothetical protein VML58_23195, partial [Burkholderiaceae bacterium]|nr:hypothetical protein [Burkholderiaceae bacterium]